MDIDDLKFSKYLKSLIPSDSYGDISSLKDLTALSSITAKNSKLYGDISSLKNLSKLESLIIISSGLYGDLATIPAQCRYAALSRLAKFTWGTRPSSSKILAIENFPTISNIDKMLQDQAACQVAISTSDIINYKIITATGTRTSASDAAVQTLQSNGYTVSITPA